MTILARPDGTDRLRQEWVLRDLHVALRLAVQLGTPDMLGTSVDPPVRSAFGLFQPLRDRSR